MHSIYQPGAQSLALIVLAASMSHCTECTCEDNETCGSPYDASSDRIAEVSRDSAAESSPDADSGIGTEAAADAEAMVAPDVMAREDADADTGRTCSDTGVCGCVDLQTDPHHCGDCWHECFSGACNEGVCAPSVVASGPFVPRYITVDSSYVYWVNKGATASGDAIAKVLKAGVAETGEGGTSSSAADSDASASHQWIPDAGPLLPTTLATDLGVIADVAVASGYVYWAEVRPDGGATIWRIPRSGGTREQVTASLGTCHTLALDDRIYWGGVDGVYFTNFPGTSDAGAQSFRLFDDRVSPTGLAVGVFGLYWAPSNTNGDNTIIQMVDRPMVGLAARQAKPVAGKAGCDATTLALSSADVYWGCQGEDQAGYVLKAPLAGPDGGTSAVIAATGSPWGMTVDDSKVFWCDAVSGEIVWAPLDGIPDGEQRHIVGHHVDKESCRDGFAVDATDIYWTNPPTGAVVKTPKP